VHRSVTHPAAPGRRHTVQLGQEVVKLASSPRDPLRGLRGSAGARLYAQHHPAPVRHAQSYARDTEDQSLWSPWGVGRLRIAPQAGFCTVRTLRRTRASAGPHVPLRPSRTGMPRLTLDVSHAAVPWPRHVSGMARHACMLRPQHARLPPQRPAPGWASQKP